MNSRMADYVFDSEEPRLTDYGKEIVVLQVMLCGDEEFLTELIYKEDYDVMFNIENDLKESGE